MFPKLPKYHLTWIFIAIVALRFVVGFHFFREGTAKLQDPNWTAEYFLKAAKGPLAGMYHQVLDDPEGKLRLCIENGEDGSGIEINPAITVELFRDFVDRAKNTYRFGDLKLLEELALSRDTLGVQIRRARERRDASVDTVALELKRKLDEESILTVRKQQDRADEILETHITQLTDWLASNDVELRQYYATSSRLSGFERDGKDRDKVATYVESLRGQIDTIRSDREKKLRSWTGEIEAIYDSLESQINDLAVSTQLDKAPVELHRPYDRDNSYLNWIDRIVPWFDTTVGVLLILGLFTRIAAVAGALFLLSVCLSQPFWLPGTTDTIYQAIEMLALFTLFATCAGRFAGLDYFLAASAEPDVETQDGGS